MSGKEWGQPCIPIKRRAKWDSASQPLACFGAAPGAVVLVAVELFTRGRSIALSARSWTMIIATTVPLLVTFKLSLAPSLSTAEQSVHPAHSITSCACSVGFFFKAEIVLLIYFFLLFPLQSFPAGGKKKSPTKKKNKQKSNPFLLSFPAPGGLESRMLGEQQPTNKSSLSCSVDEWHIGCVKQLQEAKASSGSALCRQENLVSCSPDAHLMPISELDASHPSQCTDLPWAHRAAGGQLRSVEMQQSVLAKEVVLPLQRSLISSPEDSVRAFVRGWEALRTALGEYRWE